MITFKENKNIYIYSEPIDMRMGIKKIQLLVAVNFTKIEIRHSVFAFCSNKGDQIKLYYEDDYGAWLLQNRLFDKRFKWPKGLEVGETITPKQLEGLCKGLEVVESRRKIKNENVDYY